MIAAFETVLPQMLALKAQWDREEHQASTGR
jgi:hypothetical protein